MRLIYVIILLLFSSGLSAQQDLTLYQLSGVPQSNIVNPAFVPDVKMVIGFPALSSINANYNNVAFSVNDGFELDDNTLVIDFEQLVNKLKEDNYIYNQVQDQWFVFGYQFGKNYLQLGISDKVLLDFTFPKSILELALLGNAAYLGERVGVGGLGFNGTHYRELSLGYARDLDRWSVGIHTNILFGLANVYTRTSDLGIYTDPETYDITIDGDIEVNTSGLDNIDEFGNYITNLRNMGFSVDLGAAYRINDEWEISSSILDLGTIYWKHNVKSYVNNGKSFSLNGIDVKDYITGDDLDTDSIIEVITDSIADVFTLDEVNENYTTPLTPKWYFGAKYKFREEHRFYGTVNLQFFRAGIRSALSLGYEYKLKEFLSVTANYSVFSGSYANIGLGLQVRAGPVQFYIMSDNVLAGFNFFNYQTIHYRFGFNLLFGDLEPKITRSLLE